MRFHAKERKTDMVRRRRWHRKIKSTKQGIPCVFNTNEKDPEVIKKQYFIIHELNYKFYTLIGN